MIKAVFFDIDGTLLSHTSNTVPQSTRKALYELKRRGILTFTATGRHINEIAELTPLHDLPLTGWITLNGQYCYNETGSYSTLPVDQQDIGTILQMIDEEPFPCMFITAHDMIMNYHDDRVASVQAAIHTSMPPLGDLNEAAKEPVYQIVPYVDDNKSDEILSRVAHIKATRWHDYAMDFIPDAGGKDHGLLATCTYYDIDPSDTMAFGDGENDIELLKAAAIGVAMGNCDDQLKDVADYITDDIDHDGLYHALKHFDVI